MTEATKQIPVEEITETPLKRFEWLAEFVGFSDGDWQAIADSAGVVGPHLPGVLDALYGHLLSYDDTRRIFLGERGELDPAYMAIRKEHLTEWVLRIVDGMHDKRDFAEYLVETGRRHTGVAGEERRVVPPRYMVALTSFVQTALITSLHKLLPDDPGKALQMGLAWNKLLMIQLELFLKVLAPLWPQWDEREGF